MAYKKMAGITTVINQNTTLYTVPVGKIAIATLNVCNTSDSSSTVSVSIGGIFLEKNTQLPSSGVLERTALVLEANEAISITTSSVCDVRLYGIEE